LRKNEWRKDVSHKILVGCLTIFIAFGSSVSAPAFAGSGAGTVEIEHVGVFGGSQAVFFYTTVHNGPPSCNSHRQRWVYDLSTPAARAGYALLLSAQMTGKPVTVEGKSNCDLWPDSESAAYVGLAVDYSQHP
jgi:hypothetical protein